MTNITQRVLFKLYSGKETNNNFDKTNLILDLMRLPQERNAIKFFKLSEHFCVALIPSKTYGLTTARYEKRKVTAFEFENVDLFQSMCNKIGVFNNKASNAN